jgi:hypothetical protein
VFATSQKPESAHLPIWTPVQKMLAVKPKKATGKAQFVTFKEGLLQPKESNFETIFPKPELVPKKRGKGFIVSSERDLQKWEKQKRKFDDYLEKDMIPFWKPANRTEELVNPSWFNNPSNFKKVDVLAEKPEFLEDVTGKTTATTRGNRINTRMRRYSFWGLFTQNSAYRGSPPNKLPTPLIFRSNHIRVDNDDIGHLIAFQNNMYNPEIKDPFSKTMYTNKDGEWIQTDIDPFRVKRALVKSMFDSIGFENSKVVNDVLQEKLGSRALNYRDSQGQNQRLTLSEQKLAIADKILDEKILITSNTHDGREINFNWKLGNIPDFERKDANIYFKDIKEWNTELESKQLNTDDLLIAVSTKHNIVSTTTQSLLESLHNQGWITYPRSDQDKTEFEGGIKLLKPLNEFRGSQDELKILRTIQEANINLENGRPFITYGKWILRLGDTELETEKKSLLAGEKTVYNSGEFTTKTKKIGVTDQELLRFLIDNEIGTPATRTSQISELRQAGIISSKTNEKGEIVYTGDQRAIAMKLAYQILIDPDNENLEKAKISSGLLLSQKAKNSKTQAELEQTLNQFKPVNIGEFKEALEVDFNNYLEAELDRTRIDNL